MVAIAKITAAGVTKGKEYRVLHTYGDSILIILDNGQKSYRNVQIFELKQ